MEIKGLRQAVQEVFDFNYKMNIAIQDVRQYLCYSGFSDNEPYMRISNGGDFVLQYRNRELSINDAIQIMEEVGYITPDDFNLVF